MAKDHKAKQESAKGPKHAGVAREKGTKRKRHESANDETETKSTSAQGSSLLADEKILDNSLSHLFANSTVPPTRPRVQSSNKIAQTSAHENHDEENLEQHERDDEDVIETKLDSVSDQPGTSSKRKRRRKDLEDDLEHGYMQKLARRAEIEAEDDNSGRDMHIAELGGPKPSAVPTNGDSSANEQDQRKGKTTSDELETKDNNESKRDEEWEPPQHESKVTAPTELDKAGRTVFVGNVSTSAITTKSSRKELERHLVSFVTKSDKSPEVEPKKKLESLRFRSAPFEPSLPKKAAYAKKDVVDATTHSTNAYVVYATPALARQAVKHLNGTVVLDRHIRVDSVAHPAPIDHKRCVFVGNLGFVDDENNMIAANDAEGREKRRQNQTPSDVEEGLWQLFAKHGTVESVRVIRDNATRVGKGIAYVQFTDQNGVESALAEDGKKDPPMLPRRLRVSRAKAVKRNKVPGASRDAQKGKGANSDEYRRKMTPREKTFRGRVGKLVGKAAAALSTRPGSFQSPESFVFEGHRASAKQGNTGLKLGKNGKRKALPSKNSNKRAAAFRAGKVSKRS